MWNGIQRNLAVLGLVIILGCGGSPVSLERAPNAVAGCEDATPELLTPNPRMLPGRVCQACHVAGGQAASLIWTASGTVYSRADAKCNEAGIEGVTVELLDDKDRVMVRLTTNRVGNFFTAEPLGAALRARLSKDGKTANMMGLQPTGACAGCHNPTGTAPGRLFL
jgi:mono/diheme cytochrome c family protein